MTKCVLRFPFGILSESTADTNRSGNISASAFFDSWQRRMQVSEEERGEAEVRKDGKSTHSPGALIAPPLGGLLFALHVSCFFTKASQANLRNKKKKNTIKYDQTTSQTFSKKLGKKRT